MTVIAVSKVHIKCTLPQVVKNLAKVINGQFEALNFKSGPKSQVGTKICYIRLSDKLDPMKVVQNINRHSKYTASIPQKVPDLAVSKRGKIPLKVRLAHGIPSDEKPEEVFVIAHGEILTELQSKYSGLFNLSKKTGHKLLENIAQIIFERLKRTVETNPESIECGFKLSKAYRKMHPHFGDFQMILSTLHRLQDAAGVQRAQIQEHELAVTSPQPYVIDNIPYNKVHQVCTKYTDRIVKKVTEHISELKSDFTEGDTEEDIARKKVREELKKISPYLPLIVKQVILNHFVPQKSANNRIRIYGEPFLPTKEQMRPFLKRYHAAHVMRSNRMYNVLRINIPLKQLASLFAMDGTVVGGAKLVIRSSDIPKYKVPQALIKEMKAYFGVEHTQGEGHPFEQDEGEEEEWPDNDAEMEL